MQKSSYWFRLFFPQLKHFVNSSSQTGLSRSKGAQIRHSGKPSFILRVCGDTLCHFLFSFLPYILHHDKLEFKPLTANFHIFQGTLYDTLTWWKYIGSKGSCTVRDWKSWTRKQTKKQNSELCHTRLKSFHIFKLFKSTFSNYSFPNYVSIQIDF